MRSLHGDLRWGAALVVAVIWLVITALSSSAFLFVGAIIYGLALAAFIAAGAVPRPED